MHSDTAHMVYAELDPNSVRSNRLRRFFGYWDGRRGQRMMPARSDIDPVEIPWMLGYVTLHDARPGQNFRFIIDGTRTAEMFGIDMTGRTVDEYPIPDIREMIRRTLATVVETRRPLRSDLDYGVKHQCWRYERLILPLGADGANVDMLMSAVDVAPMDRT